MSEPDTMAEDAADATLELTLLAADGLKASNFLAKPRPFAVAWVDPCVKKSTKAPLTPSRSSSSQQKLHLPLSPRALRNPSSCLTVQILSPRLPFRDAKPIGTAVLPLSSVPLAGETLTLPLRRPSGRAHGSLRVSVRILWCLGAAPMDFFAGVPAEVDEHGLLPVHPTAPLMPEGQWAKSEVFVEVEGPSVISIDPTAPPMPDEHSALSDDLEVSRVSEEVEGCNLVPVNLTGPAMPDRHNGWRSFFIGLVSGTVAAVLVGAAELSND